MRILNYTPVYVIALLLTMSHSTYSKRSMAYIIFTQVRTYFNPDYIASYAVKIQPSAPGPALNMNMHVIHNFTLDPIMQINILKMGSNSVYRNILAFNIDLCRIFGVFEKSKNMLDMNVAGILDLWLNNVRKYGEVPTCPVHEGDYALRNFSLDKKNIPPFILAGKYRIEFSIYFKNTTPKIYANNCTLVVDVKNK